ncbi:MAG: hypothetical protein AABZ60_08960 [Planctomycetota bacterium]
MKLFRYFCLISLFSTCLMVTAQGVQTVIVESEGVGKEDAVTSALRLAVEQVGGVMIQSSSATQDFVLVKDVILAEARGFVSTFDVLEERSMGGGITWVKIRATVDPSGMPGRMNEISGLLKMKGYPKIMVDIPETVDGQDNSQRIVELNMQAYLKSKESRMNILSYRDMDTIAQREIKIAREKGDPSVINQMARKLGFDVIIRGDARVYLVETKMARGQARYVYSGSLRAEAVRADTAFLIANAEILRSYIDRNAADAAQNLLRPISEEFAAKMVGRIIHDWIDDVNRFTHATFYCTGVEFGDLEILEQAFSTIKAIQGFQQKGFDEDQVEYQLQIKGINLNDIAKQLNNVRLDSGKVLKVKSVKDNVMRAKGEMGR